MHALLALCVLLLLSSSGRAQQCPPPGFDSLVQFDLQEYISAPWFVLAQAPLVYQPIDELYCVRAHYMPINESNLLEGLNVFNSANVGSVDGPSKGTNRTSGSGLVAVPDPQELHNNTITSDPSKLLVGPAALLPTLASFPDVFGPYWVVAAGSSNGSCSHVEDLEECRAVTAYEWAIITGGPPNVATEKGCRTGNRPGQLEEQYVGGLWLFSRKPQDPENKEVMLAKAVELGLDTSVLVEVEHEGCNYPEP